MLVKDIMTPAVKTTAPDAGVGEAATVMCFNKISGLPVTDRDNRIVGVISEKDVLRAMYPAMEDYMQDTPIDLEKLEYEYRDVLHMKVERLMTTKVVTVSPDAPILKAVSIMCAHKIRRIPVAIGNELVGIISMGDVHKAIFQKNLVDSESDARGAA